MLSHFYVIQELGESCITAENEPRRWRRKVGQEIKDTFIGRAHWKIFGGGGYEETAVQDRGAGLRYFPVHMIHLDA